MNPTLMHLIATRSALLRVLQRGPQGEAAAAALGLGSAAAQHLCAVRQVCGGDTAAGRKSAAPALTLVFEGDCPARELPRLLRSAVGSEPIPVRAVRTARAARAHGWVRTANDTRAGSRGTLGALLRLHSDPRRLLALTAGHVCGTGSDSKQGDTLRLELDDPARAPLFGLLLDWQPNFARLPGRCDIDAGLAELAPGDAEVLAADQASLPVGTAAALAGESLRMRTRGGELQGTCFEPADARLEVGGDPALSYVVRNALAWLPGEPSQGGDSGAAVWNAFDELVGIHAGADEDRGIAYAVAIDPILRWARARPLKRGEALTGTAPAPPSARLPVHQFAPGPAASTTPQPHPGALAGAGAAIDSAAIDVLARTLYGEARSEGAAGMSAVGHVVFNRVVAHSWWGRDVVGVCSKPWQFSCWNPNDPNRQKLLTASAADGVFRLAFDIASKLAQAHAAGTRERDDAVITRGATHYYARRLVRKPRWAAGLEPCARIGGHDFFCGVA